MRALAIVTALALAACGGPSPKGIGEECFGSFDCAAGLVCDQNVSPPVCAEELSPRPPDAAVADAAVADAAVADAPPGTPDARPPDAVVAVPDAAVPDAAVPDAAVPDAAVPDAALPDAL